MTTGSLSVVVVVIIIMGGGRGSVDSATVVSQLLALLAKMLRMDFALIGHIQSIWLLQGTLKQKIQQTPTLDTLLYLSVCLSG